MTVWQLVVELTLLMALDLTTLIQRINQVIDGEIGTVIKTHLFNWYSELLKSGDIKNELGTECQFIYCAYYGEEVSGKRADLSFFRNLLTFLYRSPMSLESFVSELVRMMSLYSIKGLILVCVVIVVVAVVILAYE